MIITVTLNAAIDKSLSVPNFRLGRRHRTVEQTTMPGGKGVNVARTLKSLGQPVIATGFAGGATGTRIVEQLTEESILNDFVRIREESRTNTAVHDPTNGETTEINERGPAVSGKEIELFRDKLLYLSRGADVVVFAGSLPRGVESDVYAQLVKEVRKEARRALIRLEGAKIYPQWSAPIVQTPAIQVNVEHPPRFWKGYVTTSRDEGEVQLLLSWEQCYDYADARMFIFLLDYWQDGVKDIIAETGSKACRRPTNPNRQQRT